jgi:hypothetical protein
MSSSSSTPTCTSITSARIRTASTAAGCRTFPRGPHLYIERSSRGAKPRPTWTKSASTKTPSVRCSRRPRRRRSARCRPRWSPPMRAHHWPHARSRLAVARVGERDGPGHRRRPPPPGPVRGAVARVRLRRGRRAPRDTRRGLLAVAAGTGALVFGTHFATCPAGHLVGHRGTWRFDSAPGKPWPPFRRTATAGRPPRGAATEGGADAQHDSDADEPVGSSQEDTAT